MINELPILILVIETLWVLLGLVAYFFSKYLKLRYPESLDLLNFGDYLNFGLFSLILVCEEWYQLRKVRTAVPAETYRTLEQTIPRHLSDWNKNGF